MMRHTRETCSELTGRTACFGQPRSADTTTCLSPNVSLIPETHTATMVAPQEAFSLSKDLEYIRRLRLQSEGHTSTTSSPSGINASANYVPIEYPDHPSWIIDSGASDHMTGPGLGEDDWEWSRGERLIPSRDARTPSVNHHDMSIGAEHYCQERPCDAVASTFGAYSV